ncbi:hypothetical protein ES288_D06G145600v1 [Gossypium darwinii]|uniref:Helicase C-terminal domain-containing protein n=1 Tax=Gossypium darwinii TaxID=34276 RepID=A0A5D2CA95_GOSDA|nr:hypothetical protein ES288_D06G145600v1 [Gossypium darwinii]
MELDEWELSVEELDFLERDALQKISQQRHSSSSSSLSTNQQQSVIHSLSQKGEVPSRTLPSSIAPKANPADQCSKEQLPKVSLKFILHATGNIAAKFPYNQVLVDAFRKIPKATWNAKERLWMFPQSSLSLAEKVPCEVPGCNIEVENLHPLVQRAIAAASAQPDLQELYHRIPKSIESKLLPFQREGVRFVLQHGGRALLADEMGLGKTLQAIAVAACVRDSWPVLILAPSSLRLHWASMIEQWLNIPPPDIVVVFSQMGGSNRSGFTILSSNSKGDIHLDGLFNIISYDLVAKLENVLMASEFKVFLELTEKDMKWISCLFCELEVVKGKITMCKSEEEVKSLKLVQKNLINKIYTDSAEAKIPAVLDYLGTIVEADCKFLIFAHHQPMIEAIHQFLLKKKVGCIRIDGTTPASSRQALVNDFQEKDAIKAAVLSIKAGGVGLTLTAASTVIFAELSWTPGDLIQAEDRAHRIGQVSSVNIYYLLANDTVDDIIWDVVQNKLENLGQMLDGHENSLEVSSSQEHRSPTKQKTVDLIHQGSPGKQKTLDSFMKRCINMDDAEHQSKLKYPRNM